VLLFREAFHDRVNSPRSLIEIQSLIVDRFWRCHKRISIGVARYRKERKERRVNGIRRDERKREKERERRVPISLARTAPRIQSVNGCKSRIS